MKMLNLGSAGLITLSLAGMAFAQLGVQAEPRNTATKDAIEARDQRQMDAAHLAAWLSMGNKSQIELAELALVKSQQPDVEKFAKMMVDDHTLVWKALQKFVTTPNVDDLNNTRTAAERREIAAQNNNTMMLVGKRAADYELRMTKQLLEKYDGQDFDMGYLGQQMVAHVQMLATLEAMKDQGTEDFQQIVAGGIQKTKAHLQQAHMISRKLEDDRRNPDARPVTRPADDRAEPFAPDRPSPDTLPDTAPRPRIDFDGTDIESDIKPNATIKERPEIAPVPDLQIQP